jgi:hypothetical protein
MLNLDWHFFPVFDQLDPATAYPGTYNLGLVATSVAIAILAAFVALSISGRIVAARTPRARYAWADAEEGSAILAVVFPGAITEILIHADAPWPGHAAREVGDDDGEMPGARHHRVRRRFGYRRLGLMLKRQGIELSPKKLYRLYREERLTVRKRGGRKRALGTRAPMAIPQVRNLRWSRLDARLSLQHAFMPAGDASLKNSSGQSKCWLTVITYLPRSLGSRLSSMA